MILQALSDYYRRKTAEPGSGLAPPGFERKAIEFVILLDRDGGVVNLEDAREQEGKKRTGHAYLVPQGEKRSSGIAANLLWDNAEYVLGLVQKGKPERAAQAHQAFVARIRDGLGELDDPGVNAVLRFYERGGLAMLEDFAAWPDLQQSPGNITFRLQGDGDLVCQRPAVRRIIESAGATTAETLCLVSGEPDTLARLHPSIKGVWGAQSSGANIVSFNLDAFSSFNKEQGANAPVGERAAFAYTTALNHLLQSGSRQRLQVGDASTVFWAERRTSLEDDFADLFGEPAKDAPDSNANKIRALYQSVRQGGFTPDDDQNLFYVLGLAPNASRIAIRFWQRDTVANIARRILAHFDDIAIDHAPHEPDYPSLFRLLVHTAVQGKADNIPPNLGGDFLRAVLEGRPYPATLLQAAVRRNRAERQVDYYRAALIKGCLNRQNSLNPFMEKELAVSLDPENPSPGYRLGRLFAVLEKVQQEAQPGINATIRDRFYGAASANPLAVFATLMKLKNHHLAKLENPRFAARYERLIGEIVDGIQEFPAQLPLREQGLFSIGYYHQRQAFYRPASHTEEEK